MEDNKVRDFLYTFLIECSEVCQGLSSSCSEKHSPHTFHFTIFDCTGNKLKSSIHEWLRSIILCLILTFMNLDWHSSLELRDHLLDKLDDLKVIFELVNVTLYLIDVLALLGYELLIVHNILFNSVKEQVHGFLLFSLNRGNVLSEGFNISRLIDLDFVVFALLDQILNSSLCLVTELHSCRVW